MINFFFIQISSSYRSFSCFYRYFIMQSCWAFDSRKRPSFPNLTSFLGCQLADAEEAVCSCIILCKASLERKAVTHNTHWCPKKQGVTIFLITICLGCPLKVVWSETYFLVGVLGGGGKKAFPKDFSWLIKKLNVFKCPVLRTRQLNKT